MNYRLIDYPYFIPESTYQDALKKMVSRLVAHPEVISVYHIGGFSTPGVSDIDMIVVFKKDARIAESYLEQLSETERYLFVHKLYGIVLPDFHAISPYIFFHNFRLLHGPDLRISQNMTDHDRNLLKVQIALEFITKMKLTIYLQQLTKVLRLRDLLLHVKALQYDLDFLGIIPRRISEKVNQVVEWRTHWFSSTPSKDEVISWWNEFTEEFELFQQDVFKSYQFFLPYTAQYKISRKFTVIPSGSKLAIVRKGLILPSYFSLMGKNYFRVLNKLNSFTVYIPVSTEKTPEIIEEKFKAEKKHIEYNRLHLPGFFALASSLQQL